MDLLHMKPTTQLDGGVLVAHAAFVGQCAPPLLEVFGAGGVHGAHRPYIIWDRPVPALRR